MAVNTVNFNLSNLDENFPREGLDQPSQGFRTNFEVIKRSLQTSEDQLNYLGGLIDQLPGIENIQWEWIQDKPLWADGQFDGSYVSLTNKPENFSTSWALINNKPTFATVATTGNYNDLLNQPIYPTDLSQLTNINNQFTTDDVPQGSTNLYLTLPNISLTLDQYSEVPGDVITNSVETTASVSTTNLTDTLSLTTADQEKFVPGHKVKIFGANVSTNNVGLVGAGTINFVTKNGFLSVPSNPSSFTYKIAQFDYASGKYSAAGSSSTQVSNLDLELFNTANNVVINFTRTSTGNGVLIYRKIEGAVTTAGFNLIAVLGPKDLPATTGSFTDFYDFDLTAWSGKNIERNDFEISSGIIHFPVTSPVTPGKGWVAATVGSVVGSAITLTESFYFNSTVTISHDDTALIQSAITARKAKNLNSLKLNDKQYIISNLIVPSNFSIIGKSKNTVLKKLSWSNINPNNTSNFVIQGSDVTGISNTRIGLTGFKIDGNQQNQYLTSETTDEFSNYTIGIRGTFNTIDNLEMTNVLGGGISADQSTDITIINSKISNSGLSDRHSYSPLRAGNSDNVLIASNMFKNFPDSIDLSVSNIGTVNGNVVANCGAGILIYGATKFVSSPNLILGPADEFIPGPDIYNSEYDSVNVILEPNINYLSDQYVYQENGELFDLTANRAVVSYRVDKLRKVDNVEELYGEVQVNAASPITGITNTNLADGEFRFNITSTNVGILKSTYSYSTLKAADENHVGLVYRALLTEYVPSGTVSGVEILSTGQNITFYEVTIVGASNLSVGSRVKFLNHGGTPDLNIRIGTITAVNASTSKYTIQYDVAISSPGTTGSSVFICVENTFVLAKGRIL